MAHLTVVTTEFLPGYRVQAVLGGVMGITARSNNPYLEGIKFLDGRRNPDMVSWLLRWREEALQEMMAQAAERGANAVLGMRFDHRPLTDVWSEICAYGTAVVVAPQATVDSLTGADVPGSLSGTAGGWARYTPGDPPP